MRSRFTALGLVALSSVVGCGGGYDGKSAPQSPSTGGYVAYPSPAATAGERRIEAAPRDTVLRGQAVAAREEALEASSATDSDSAGGAPAPAPPPPPPQPPQAAEPSAAMKPEKADPTTEPAKNRDLVIYTARFTMAVYEVNRGLDAVEKIARDNGGYLGHKKDREITVRVPRGRFEAMLAAVNGIGDVLHREIQAEDVTDEHVDLEIRIKNARAMQRRLTDLLTRASVKDALEIEKELHRVTEELERLEGRMKVLKDRIAFSTITVIFEPRNAQIVAARARLPFPWLQALNLPSLLSLYEEK
ncbi:MAG: DUF4349 domain-containing protein [Myxococcales bacterium]|nr:DUF4349 domain-containing protein [Myxococcales bacterium]